MRNQNQFFKLLTISEPNKLAAFYIPYKNIIDIKVSESMKQMLIIYRLAFPALYTPKEYRVSIKVNPENKLQYFNYLLWKSEKTEQNTEIGGENMGETDEKCHVMLRLNPELHGKLKHVAEQEKRSMSKQAEYIIKRYIEKKNESEV